MKFLKKITRKRKIEETGMNAQEGMLSENT
jgi:hypothetical protein